MLDNVRSKKAKTKSYNSAIKILAGFVARVRVRCGKSNCRCNRGARHLAHYHVTYSKGFRIRQYVRRDQVTEVRAACEVNRALQAQLRAGRTQYKRVLARTRELIKYLVNE